jgi:hypothetical protein
MQVRLLSSSTIFQCLGEMACGCVGVVGVGVVEFLGHHFANIVDQKCKSCSHSIMAVHDLGKIEAMSSILSGSF